MHISIHMYIYIYMIEPVDIYTTTAVPLSTGNDNAIVKKIIHPKLSVAGCHNKTRPTRAQHGRVTSFLPVIHAACGNRDAFTNRYVGESYMRNGKLLTLHLYHSLANSVAVACHQSAIGQFCYIFPTCYPIGQPQSIYRGDVHQW